MDKTTQTTHEQCSICLENIIDTTQQKVLDCSHIYHKTCIYVWIGHNKNSCPLCRETIFKPVKVNEIETIRLRDERRRNRIITSIQNHIERIRN